MTRTISRNDFNSEVLESNHLALVQFSIEWSGACQIMAPVYSELAVSYQGIVNFFTVDTESSTGLENDYGVVEFPTILFFKKGIVIDYIRGLAPKNLVVSKIERALRSTELN